MVPDAELLRRYFEKHCEQAFAALVQRHIDAVYFAALRRTAGDTALAEDVCQEVFAALAVAGRKRARIPLLAGWLHTAVRYKAAHAVQAERRRRVREERAMREEALRQPGDDGLDWERARPLIDDVLHGLPPFDREIVLLRFFRQQAFAEIGTQLGVSADAARFRLERACEKMRRALLRRGIPSTTAALGAALSAQAARVAPAGIAARIAAGSLGRAAAAKTAAGLAAAAFMPASKTSLAFLAAALAVTTGIASFSLWQAHAASVILRNAAAEVARDNIRLHPLEQELAKNTRHAASAVPPAPVFHAPLREGDGANAAAIERGNQLMRQHPELRAALLRAQRATFELEYGALFRELGLSPEQVETFLQTLLDAAPAQHYTGRPAYWFQLGAGPVLTSSERDDRIRSLLGDAGFQGYEAVAREQPQLLSAGAIAASMGDMGEALTPAQFGQLEASLVQATNAAGESSSVNWTSVQQDSAAYLTEPQRQELALNAEYEVRQQAYLRALSGQDAAAGAEPAK